MMIEWLTAATFGCAVLAAVFAGLGWRAQRRRGGDGTESDKRIEERLDALGAELKDNRDKVVGLTTTVERMNDQMGRLSDEVKTSAENIRKSTEERLDSMRGETRQSLQDSRESGEKSMHNLRHSVDAKLTETANKVGEMRDKTAESLDAVRKDTEVNLNKLRESVEGRLDGMRRQINDGLKETRESGEKKLEQIRATVDEKLQTTLEKRLGEQFRTVGAQLDSVHKGLGEMQALASKVGDLQRVLTSVPARGAFGEQTLKSIIREFLTPEQYVENAQIDPDGGEKVEIAIRVPIEGVLSLLPVDSKFPTADYDSLVKAGEQGDKAKAALHRKGVLRAVKTSADHISSKYIRPPHSTEFAFLFLPTEGLYAVVASEPGFLEEIRQTRKVMVAGPSNFAFFLSAVRSGFQLFAAGQRADDVRKVLGAVKTEFKKINDILKGIERNLKSATDKVGDLSGKRFRAMERTLREVEALPENQSGEMLGIDSPTEEREEE